jgi:hypothetical protein
MKPTQFKDSTILLVLVVGGLVTTLASLAINPAGAFSSEWWASLLQGLGAEMFGAAATFWLVELILSQRRGQERRRELYVERKTRLLVELRSRSNDAAKRAIAQLRAEGWLVDGILKGSNLSRANFYETDLDDANLESVNLEYANLEKAWLRTSKLEGASLFCAKMHGARLHYADMRNTDLSLVELQNADLTLTDLRNAVLFSSDLQNSVLVGTDLRGANLLEANLENVTFNGLKFDEATILPDGKNWTPNSDLTCFTNPAHANFFRSQAKESILLVDEVVR